MTEEDIKFNKGTSMWKGKMLMDMTREELYEAFWQMGQNFLLNEKQYSKDLESLSDLVKKR